MQKCGSARPTQKLARHRSRARSGRYFGGAATNKFNTKNHTIQKEILKYLKHYSKFHEVFIYEIKGIAKSKISNSNYKHENC